MTGLLLFCALGALSYRPSFLDVSVSARATALGGALSGPLQDAGGVFVNPATPSRDGVLLSLTDWYQGARLTAGAGSYRLNFMESVVSAGAVYYLSADQLGAGGQSGLPPVLSTSSLLAKLAVNRRLSDAFYAGFAVGYITDLLNGVSARSLSGDIGLRVRRPKYGAALVVRDFTGFDAPFVKSLSVYVAPLTDLLISLAAEHTDRFRVRAGAEWIVDPAVLRVGFDGEHPCAGVGLRLSGMSLEYATVIDTRNGLIHQLSVGINL